MKDNEFKKTDDAQNGHQPQPWDRQTDEPVDHYHWFKVYLTLPVPRKVAQVAKLVGTNSERTWMAKIARKWEWKERAALLDADKAEQIVIQAAMREQLLLEKLFEAQFFGLLETTQAIANAEIDRMDRDEARGHFSLIARHQLGLLRITAQQSEQISEESLEELNKARLAQEVEERALAIVEEEDPRTDELMKQIWGDDEESAETCSDSEDEG